MEIKILDQNGKQKAAQEGAGQVAFGWEGSYEKGDQIVFTFPKVPGYYIIRADDAMDEAYVYATRTELIYEIPFAEKKRSYNPKCFTGGHHYLTLRYATDYEQYAYKNLAKNVLDQHGNPGCYPHVFANVETRGEAVFAARNAIDGVVANLFHGEWPYESWGINRQDDAELTLEFGRAVDFDKIVIYTRADFPHDNWWEQVTFTFSDGSKEVVELEKSIEPHVIEMKKHRIQWLKFGQLIKADDPSPFPALTQIEVYGTDN